VNRSQRDSAAPYLLLAAAAILSVVVLLWLSSGLTFYQDTWAFLMHRRDFSAAAFLKPHNEHLVLVPVAIEKALVTIFGMSSALPEYIVLNLLLVTTAVLVFVYVRRRVGAWPALLGTVLVLFLGPAWQVLLWPFEIALVGSTMTGIGMLLALEREDRRGDLWACLLLVLSIAFSSLGVAFAVGAVVDILQRRRSRGLKRAYVPAIPIALYGAWYLAYGREVQSTFSLHNLIHSPVFLVEGFSASVGALSGLSVLTGNTTGRPYAGFALLAVLAALLAYRLWRQGSIPARFWPVASSAAAFWLLAGINRSGGREATASRYLHVGAILVLLIAADLLKGARFGIRALLVGAAVVIAASAINFGELEDGSDSLREETVLTRSDLGAMEISSRTISPYLGLTPELAGTGALVDVNATEYFAAAHESGTPAYTTEELARAPEAGRRQADIILSRALPIETASHPGASLGAGVRDCVVLPGGSGAGGREVRLEAGLTRIAMAPGPIAPISLRRFAVGEHPVEIGAIPGDSVTTMRIPSDRASQPWYLLLKAEQRTRVCRGG
jgi:hypothetical protein